MQKLRINTKHSKKLILIAKAFLGLTVFFSTLPSLSAIPYRNAYEALDLVNNQTKELNLDLFAKIHIMLDERQLDLTKYIPYQNLPEYDDGSRVAGRIVARTLKNLIDDTDRDVPIVNGARRLNSSLETSFKNDKHAVEFKIRASQAMALVTYRGYVDAALSYEIDSSELKFEVTKAIGRRTLAFTHLDNPEGVSDIVGVRWQF